MVATARRMLYPTRMRSACRSVWFRVVALAAVVLAAVLPGAATAQTPAIERAVAAAEALGARTGVAIVEADGTVIYRHRPHEAFAPASNMKVLTAAAVILGLGSDYQFRTVFRLQQGRLVVEASGDPNWIADSAHAPEVVFGRLAHELTRRGVVQLAGIELDAGAFTGPSRPPTWPQDQLHTYYCAPTGPFVLEQGTFLVRIEPSDGPRASCALLAPPAGLPLRGSPDMVDRGKRPVYGALDLGDAIQVRGSFGRRSSPVTIRTSVNDPAAWYLATLRQALTGAGIGVGQQQAPVPEDGIVFEYRSDLGPALLRMLEDSSNFDAEQCLRVLGKERRRDGSLAGGVAELEAQLTRLVGTIAPGIVLTDGSGLSHQNRLTPELLLTALRRASDARGGAVLRACMPIAGRSGTLSDRFTGTDLVGRVHAKTGWIRGASALSGFVERRDKSVATFVILMNYDRDKGGLNKDLKQIQETIVRAVDSTGAPR
jgi:serine-type D-Ala-D-Ala carboxypeptidase/endopeptidase (penicillin-binding protein 4)